MNASGHNDGQWGNNAQTPRQNLNQNPNAQPYANPYQQPQPQPTYPYRQGGQQVPPQYQQPGQHPSPQATQQYQQSERQAAPQYQQPSPQSVPQTTPQYQQPSRQAGQQYQQYQQPRRPQQQSQPQPQQQYQQPGQSQPQPQPQTPSAYQRNTQHRNTTAPGWYTNPQTGKPAYWDGKRWNQRGKKPKKGHGKVIAISVSAVAILAIVALVGAFFLLKPKSAPVETKEQVYGNRFSPDKYDLQDPISQMPSDKDIEIPLSHSAYNKLKNKNDDDMYMTNSEAIAQVFADPDLTLPAEYIADYDANNSSLHLVGSFGVGDKDEYGFSEDMGWGGYDGYWLLVKKDKNGKDLKKPKLTYFTVKDTYVPDSLSKPVTLSLSVNSNGALQMDWPKVDGAAGYRLYTIAYDANNTSRNKSITREIGDVKSNSTSLDKLKGFCGAFGECQEFGDSVTDVNQQIAFLVRQSYDNAEQCRLSGSENCNAGGDYGSGTDSDKTAKNGDPYTFDPAQDLAQGWIGVAALDKDKKPTHMTTASLTGISGNVPLRSADFANSSIAKRFLNDTQWSSSSDDEIKRSMSYFVTMADGSTRTAYIQLGKATRDAPTSNLYTVKYTVPGTPFQEDLTLYSNNADAFLAGYKAKLNAAIAEDGKNGLVPVTYKAPEDALDYSKIEKTAIDSKPVGKNGVEKYKPQGSSEEVQYVMENLLARHRMIKIDSGPSSIDMSELYEELLYQSPYLNAALRSHEGKGIQMRMVDKDDGKAIYVQYADDVQQTYDELYKKVHEVAGTITGGDSADGVSQIENYLAANAEYDYDAYNASESGSATVNKDYPYAWSTGTLLHGKGVCMSYASMFDAIADQVGIESYVVIGQVAAGLHAWNRVKIDGKFYDTDPTWDDGGASAGTEYFMKPANQLPKHKVDAGGWMPSGKVNSYGGYNTAIFQ